MDCINNMNATSGISGTLITEFSCYDIRKIRKVLLSNNTFSNGKTFGYCVLIPKQILNDLIEIEDFEFTYEYHDKLKILKNEIGKIKDFRFFISDDATATGKTTYFIKDSENNTEDVYTLKITSMDDFIEFNKKSINENTISLNVISYN